MQYYAITDYSVLTYLEMPFCVSKTLESCEARARAGKGPVRISPQYPTRRWRVDPSHTAATVNTHSGKTFLLDKCTH